MGFFDFLKKKGQPPKASTTHTEVNSFGERYDKLTSDGELPWGWTLHNKEFTEKIGSEYSYFLNMWLDARSKAPKELYPALKSFVLYLEDAESLCKAKGECFEYWYYEILTSRDYLEKRKEELKELTLNLDYLQEIYIKKQNLKPVVIHLLKENDGILQSEFKNLFDEPFQNEVSNIIYALYQAGEVEKTKSGRSYILHYKK